MFELLVTLCLQADPAICAERLLPRPDPVSAAVCQEQGEVRAQAWLADYPDLSLMAWRCEAREDWLAGQEDFAINEVAPGLFVHQGRHEPFTADNAGDIANIGFVVGEEAIAVIDAGGSRQLAEGLLAAVWRTSDLPIRWLILTHMHPDHVMGASLFQEAGARLIGHRKLPEALSNRRQTYEDNMRRLLGDEAFIASRLVLPDETLEDRRELDLGKRPLLLQAHPTAHSDNDMTLLDRASDSWWLSDLVFVGHTPALDGSITAWLALLESLSAQPVARIVPGHGPASLPWPEGGHPVRDYLTALAEETREAIARGESMGEAIGHLGQSQAADWLLFEDYNPRNATAAFKELEWE